VLGTAFVGAVPIRDAESWRAVSDASLTHPLAYTILAPFCTVLDALTLLSVRQHAALLATAALCVLVWRVLRVRRRGTTIVREIGVALASLGGAVAVYAIGALIPRPMAALRAHSPDDVVVDFHSHTTFSKDARQWFTPERNRAWHTDAGFDAAYVSDHKTTQGALIGMAGNATRPKGATVLLPSLESRDHSEHVNVYGLDPHAYVRASGEWNDPPAPPSGPAPFLMLTIPGNLDRLPENETSGVARVLAIELADGAPKGVDVMQRDRERVLKLADSLGLAVVAGSDNHGWGSTAQGWTLLRIPGWRALTPAQLDSAIQWTVRTERRRAARTYVRDSPNPGRSAAAVVFTVPAVIWRVLVDLDWLERVSWIGWIVLSASIASVPSSRAARETTSVAPRRKSANA
jgi:hypothetical protein